MQRARILRFVCIAFLFPLCLISLHAQGTSGAVTGTVTDATDAILPGAEVTITNPISGYSQKTKSDSQGQYRFANLPFGRYHVAAAAAGFQSLAQDAQVRSAAATTLDFKLAVGGSQQVVNVEAAPEDMVSVDPTSGNAVDRNLFERLPMESTNAPLSALVTGSTPGIAGDSDGLFHPMGEHADTTYSIDGQPVSDQQSRVFGNQLSLNAIQSVNVVNGIAPPEYGDKASLVVQTTTRSGLNLARPTGTISYSYGSFGSSVGSFALGIGDKRFGNFFTADGVDSGRYLDTPEFRPMHAHGNNENFFDRVDYDPDQANQIQLNMTASRSWFQNPNQYDQQAAGQDQRAQIFSYNLSPSWTHTVNPHSLFTVNPYLRQDNFHYYPSKDAFDDTPVTLGQSRRLQNAGIKADYSYSHGIHTVKAGVMFYHTFLHEGFSLGITDPTFNAPCLNPDGTPNTNPVYKEPSDCPAGDTANPSFNAGSAPFDLTRGGDALPLQWADRHQAGGDLSAGQRGLQRFHVSAGRTYRQLQRVEQPVAGGATAGRHVPGEAHEYRAAAGIRQALPDSLQREPAGFELDRCGRARGQRRCGTSETRCARPIRRRVRARPGEAPGGERRVLLEVHGAGLRLRCAAEYSAGVSNSVGEVEDRRLRHQGDGAGVAWALSLFGAGAYEVAVLQPGDWRHPVQQYFRRDYGPFRIDHDQAFQQSTHVQYQPFKRGPWYGITWRYESGEVAGNAPFATAEDVAQGFTDLTYLTPDQQAQAQVTCGGVVATLTAPLKTCPIGQLSSPLLRLPAPGTENDDRNPPRVAPRTVFDMGAGWDNILHRDRWKTNVSLTAVNVTDKYALYNFLSTFSGTHFVAPRTVSAQVTLNF